MTVTDLYKKLLSTLTPVLGDSEARSAARVILEDVRGITQTDLVVNGHRTVEPETLKQIEAISDRICAGEPVQYAVGSARFYGMDFKVNPSVLIPRPETEGLVDMIVRDYGQRSDLRVLDCGTGSGCIAIALARNLPFASVDAIDISPDALKVATDNSSRLKVKVNFSCRDISILSDRMNRPMTSLSAILHILPTVNVKIWTLALLNTNRRLRFSFQTVILLSSIGRLLNMQLLL